MIEAVFLASALAVLALAATILYSRRIRWAQKKYLEARSIVEDIVVSFNKQLGKLEDKLEASTNKLDDLSKRSDQVAEELTDYGKTIQAVAKKAESSPELEGSLLKINALDQRLRKVESMKDLLQQKITEIGKRETQKREVESRIESAFPIKREKALAPLTETELTVLELLADKGEKTAPQIREQIKLSREHTARLMKKLYVEGYLERSANKIPFTYSIKEEMEKILRKTKTKEIDS